MQPRYVVVPALPVEVESFRVAERSYTFTTSGGFDIYDNQEKTRLKLGFSNRTEAQDACARMNAESRDPEQRFPILRTD